MLKYKNVIILSSILAVTFLLRLPFIWQPFYSLDEGLYATSANMLLHGAPPDEYLTNAMFPLLHFVYAILFFIFGQDNMAAIHFASIILILFTAYILYRISQLIFDEKTGLWASGLFCIFTFIGPDHDMLAFNKEWLIIFFNTLAAYFFIKFFIQATRHYYYLFISGLFFGLGFLSKPLALFDYMAMITFYCIYIFYRGIKIKQSGDNKSYTFFPNNNYTEILKACAASFAGFLSVIALCLLYIFTTSESNIYSTFIFPAASLYSSIIPLQIKIIRLIDFMTPVSSIKPHFLFLICSYFASIVLIITSDKTDGSPKKKQMLSYMIIWAFYSFISGSVTGRFFGHYFIVVLPPVCLVTSFVIQHVLDTVQYMLNQKKKKQFIVFTKTAVAFIIVYMAVYSPMKQMQYRWPTIQQFYLYGQKKIDIPKSISMLANYIKTNSTDKDKILVWGYWPEIYSYCSRLPASGHFVSNWLVGLIPWEKTEPHIDTSAYILPGIWDTFMQDLYENKPMFIIDTAPSNPLFAIKYPIRKYKPLEDFIQKSYTKLKVTNSDNQILFYIYKKK